MRWRQVVLLYVVALVLAGAYFRPGARERAAEGAAEPRRPKLFALDVATLSEITIEHAGRRVVARRDGEGWVVEEPAQSQVPSGLVQAFAAAVLEAEAIEQVGGNPDLASFGLSDDATRVELRPSGGPPETLWLGSENPSGTAVYARRLGTPGVVLVGRTLRYYEELILQALPRPTVPADTPDGPVARRGPLTSRRAAV
jgi:hypothetical protein